LLELFLFFATFISRFSRLCGDVFTDAPPNGISEANP